MIDINEFCPAIHGETCVKITANSLICNRDGREAVIAGELFKNFFKSWNNWTANIYEHLEKYRGDLEEILEFSTMMKAQPRARKGNFR